ncbi:MAG: hypothetical protein LBE24_08870 [Methylobacillus sp.]|jgi:hypothetical protein|nr:hypothetical protein [Methylobacillus sp.]
MLRLLFFMTSVIATSASIAGDITPCSADTVSFQVISQTGKSRVITTSGFGSKQASDPNSYRYALMASVRERVAVRLAEKNLCQDIAKNKERSLIQFVDWPFSTLQKKLTVPALPPDTPSSGGCRITSPWLDVAFERKPVPQIRAIVFWNERQLWADQAILDGAKNVPSGVMMPLMGDESIDRYATDYAESEIASGRRVASVEERIPPDLLWLFRHSPQQVTMEFFLGSLDGMKKAKEKGAEGHKRLVFALIDRCFDSNGETLHYDSILDAKDLVPLEEYKIDTLI